MIAGAGDVTAAPPIVAVIVLLPAVVPVKVAVYVPFLLSVTALNVPLPVPLPSANTTFKPPAVSLLPTASSACSVTVSVLPETTPADDSVTNEFEKLAAPGVTVIAGAVEVTAMPPIVAVTVLLPAVVPVKVAVYVPFLLSVTALNVPLPVPLPSANTTVRPPVVSLLPAASSACSVTVSVLPEATLAADNVTMDFDRLAGPGVTVIAGAVEVTAVPPIDQWCSLPAVVAGERRRIRAVLVVGHRAKGPAWPPLVLPGAKVTVRPPVVSLLPAASSACNVTVSVLPEATLAADNVTMDFARLAGPIVTVIAGAVEVTAVPPIVAVTVLLPAVVPVKVAVYVPFLLSVTALNVPLPIAAAQRENTAFKPPAVRRIADRRPRLAA